MKDVEINGLSVLNEFDLELRSITISPPAPKLKIIPVSGTSNTIDLSEILSGDVEYDKRSLKMSFNLLCGRSEMLARFSAFSNFMHGQDCQIIVSEDPGFYYTGRMVIEQPDIQNWGGKFEISGEVDPYKYEVNPATYNISAFPGDLTIAGNRKRISPVITCSNIGMVSYLENNYPLKAGINRIPEIFFGAGEHVLTFAGSGTTSVDYQGASL